MKLPVIKMVKPDFKGRITLGHLADGISRFAITQDKENRLILVPYVEVPAHERWLFDNKAALKQVKQGLKESSKGLVINRGSFVQYADGSDKKGKK